MGVHVSSCYVVSIMSLFHVILVLASTKLILSFTCSLYTLNGSSSQTHAPIDSSSINVGHDPTSMLRKR